MLPDSLGGGIVFWLESCPRCHGDLISNNDLFGSYVYCLQCAHYLTEAEEGKLKSVSPKKSKAANGKSKSPQSGTVAFPPVVHIKIPATIAA